MKYLIVNADDFGMTDGINAGVIEAHTRGVVTSASLMVKQPAAPEAARLAAAHPGLGMGLHIDLIETEPPGVQRQSYARVDLRDQSAVAAEIEEQLGLFVRLVGREPDHLDSHQHAHFSEPVRQEAVRVAARLDVPLRRQDPRIAFRSEFYGHRSEQPSLKAVSLAGFLSLVDALQDGWSEVMCHPGHAGGLGSVYSLEREAELATLCAPGLREAIRARGAELRSFADFRRAGVS